MISTNRRRPSESTPMNRSTNYSVQVTPPGGPSPDYESTEAPQNKATSASGEVTGPNSQTLGGAPGITDKSSQEGVDVLPGHSVVSRQTDFASAQLTGKTSSDPAPQEGVDVPSGHSVVSRRPDLPSAQSPGNSSSDPPQPALYSDIEGRSPPVRGFPEPSYGATAAVAVDPKSVLSEDSGYLSRGPSDAAPLHPENPPPSPEVPAGGDDARRSVSLASRHTDRNLAVDGSTFANGGATTTPDVDPTSLQARAENAEDELRPRDKAVISREENSVGRKLSKIVRNGARPGKASLDVALRELCEIQKLQKASIKEEAESLTRHSRAQSDAHKAEMKLLIARTGNEREQAGLRAAGEELEACRKHARQTTKILHDKMQEVERLRVHKGVDDRERAVRVKSLNGQRKKGLGRVLRSE